MAILLLVAPATASGRVAAATRVAPQAPTVGPTLSGRAIPQRALRAAPARLLQALDAGLSHAAKPKPTAPKRPVSYGGFYRIADGGFGQPQNAYAWTMEWFNGKLYVGTSRNNLCNAAIVQQSLWTRNVTGCPDQQDYLSLDMRAQIWAYTPQTNSWRQVFLSPMVNQFINGHVIRLARDAGYRTMAIYTDSKGVTALYVGTAGFGDLAYLLRSVDGVHWETLGPAGLGIHANSIRALTSYAGRLFVAPIGVYAKYYASGGRDRVFMSDDPASGKWTEASRIGFGDPANTELYSMIVYNGQLYAGISDNKGFQLWRTNAQGKTPYTWTAVLIDGAYRGSPNPTITAMEIFHGKLFIGTAAATLGPGGAPAKGSEIIEVNPDDSWNLIMGQARQTPEGYKAPLSGIRAGFNDHFNVYLWNLAVHNGILYAGTYDYSTFILPQYPVIGKRLAGFDLWKSRDGIHWSKISTTGFGNPFNYGVRTMLDTPYGFFLGTANPFANAPNHQGGAEIWLMPNGNPAQPHGVALSSAPCPMAHCAPSLDNNQNIAIPAKRATEVWHYHQPSVNFALGLGCTTGRRIIVCAGTGKQLSNSYDAAYLYALDFQGHLLWDSRRLLDDYVLGSVPLIDSQDNVYVSDNNWIISFTSDGVVRWQVPNPARAVLVSLNIVSSGYLVAQAGLAAAPSHGLLMVINPQTGAIASTLDLLDTVNNYAGEYGTANTVTVVGNRLYTVTQFVPFGQHVPDMKNIGRLYAIDVDSAGQLHPAWYFPYQGPSGASPLVVPGPNNMIYFDGTGTTQATTTQASPPHVVLFAVRDVGHSGVQQWVTDLTTGFGIQYSTTALAAGIQATPAHDPRGGIWVWSEFDRRLFRLDEATGTAIESLDMGALTHDADAQPDGVITIVPNGGNPVLIIGVLAGAQHLNSVDAINLTSRSLLWSNPVGSGPLAAPFGQFPIAPAGNTPLLIAPTADGIVHAYALR